MGRCWQEIDYRGRTGIVGYMSLAELKREVDRLSDAEKRELEVYLRERADQNLAARRERVGVIMREMDAGRKFSRGDLERVDQELTERGL